MLLSQKSHLPLSRYEAGEELKERTVDDTRMKQAWRRRRRSDSAKRDNQHMKSALLCISML